MKDSQQGREAAALELLRLVADAERKNLSSKSPAGPDRRWLFDTYADCLKAVRGGRVR